MGFSDRPEKKVDNLLRTIDDLSWGFEYRQTFSLKKEIKFKLGCAGHILGSCFIRFELPDGFTIVFSGDLGAKDTPGRALDDGGIVYIPAFSLGRTQELIYELDRIGTKVPVFIDSPLGLEITKIYSSLSEYWDKEAKELKAKGDHPIDFKNLYSVERFRDHKKLLQMDGPAIIIAGSGMCTGKTRLEKRWGGLFDG